MKKLSNFIIEKFRLSKDNLEPHYNYQPKTKNELKQLVDKLIKERGNDADLNDIDTSEITDMSSMFEDSKFNGDISNWDVSKVKDMEAMFASSEFNGDISQWDVSKVKNMGWVFNFCPLHKNPPKWYKE